MKSYKLWSFLDGAMRHVILIIMAFVSIIPFYWMVITSLKPKDEISAGPNLLPTSFSFHAYINVWNNTKFPQWFGNSLMVAGLTTLLALTLGCLAGYAMSRWAFKGRSSFNTLLLLVQMFPLVLVGIPLYLVMAKLNAMDTPLALVAIYMTFSLPFAIVMMKSFFDGIPRSLEEAATIDGCTPMQAFTRIVLPLSGPGLTSVAVYTFLLAWNEFFIAYLFLKRNLTLPIGLQTFIAAFFTEWDSLMAAASLTTIPVLLFYMLLQRYLTTGMTAGATKG